MLNLNNNTILGEINKIGKKVQQFSDLQPSFNF